MKATLKSIRAAYRAELEWARGRPGHSLLPQLRAAAKEKRQELEKRRALRATAGPGSGHRQVKVD